MNKCLEAFTKLHPANSELPHTQAAFYACFKEGWEAAINDVLESAPCACSDKRRYDRGEHLSGCYLFDLNLASAATSAAPKAQPSQALPEGWVPLRIEYEPGYPEDVAFGPQRMMDRLKQWLDKFFALNAESQAQAPEEIEALYREIGRQMVAMTTTVRGPDEWLAIPELWRRCMEERDRAYAELSAQKAASKAN